MFDTSLLVAGIEYEHGKHGAYDACERWTQNFERSEFRHSDAAFRNADCTSEWRKASVDATRGDTEKLLSQYSCGVFEHTSEHESGSPLISVGFRSEG